jgi:DNA modification methylase
MSVTVLTGDCRQLLKSIPANSVQTMITSPPYFGLRDYGTAVWEGGSDPDCTHKPDYVPRSERPVSPKLGVATSYNDSRDEGARAFKKVCGKCGATRIDHQIGLEETLDDFLHEMVTLFQEVRRVLHPSGTVWLNIGDTYNSGTKGGRAATPSKRDFNHGYWNKRGGMGDRHVADSGTKPKDLMMVPALLALALRADGWYLRSDIIWVKKAAMPESVTDRPTSAYEHIFLLSKNRKYYYDSLAVREGSVNPDSRYDHFRSPKYVDQNGASNNSTHQGTYYRGDVDSTTRNARNVWILGPEPFRGDDYLPGVGHFATFPTEVPRRCILAGTSEKGMCPHCYSPWVRSTEPIGEYAEALEGDTWESGGLERGHDKPAGYPRVSKQERTIEWKPSCSCPEHNPVPQMVLDIFGGAGTTGLVADRLGRNATLMELNPAYVTIINRRLSSDAPLFVQLDDDVQKAFAVQTSFMEEGL